MTYTIAEHNCETGETIVREMTKEEAKEHEALIAKQAEVEALIQAEEAAKAEAKASALAKLAALGLTEDEAKAIVG